MPMPENDSAADGPGRSAQNNGDGQFVTALARGLMVLRCFTPQRQELGTSEIAALTGLAQPTVWRLCNTLQKLGYLRVARRGKLAPGVPLLALGFAVIASLDFLDLVRPHLQRMASDFRAAVALSERDRMSMIYLDRCHGDSVFLLNLRAGARIPIFNSAAGWAHLAALDATDRAELIEAIRERSGEGWPAVQQAIETGLADYERLGFIPNFGVQHPDINAVAVPIRSASGRILALNCSGLRIAIPQDVMLEKIGPELVRVSAVAADALSSFDPPADDHVTSGPDRTRQRGRSGASPSS